MALVGPQRVGQDHPGRGPAVRRRGHQPQGGSRTAPRSATSSPRRSSATCRSRWPWPRLRVGRPQDQPDRHAPATPTSSARSWPACSVADLAVFVVERGRGRRGADRGGCGRLRRRAGPAPAGLRQQARPGAGQLRAHPRRAAGAPSAPASPRSSCPSARRPASAASPTCSPTPPSPTTSGKPHDRARSPTTWPRSSTRCTTPWSRASWWPTTS